MKKLKWYRKSAMVFLPACLMAGMARGQQTGVASKPAKSTATTAASTASAITNTTAAAAADSSGKTVLKVGATQVTERDIDFLISNLNPQARQSLATQGRQALGDEYMKMLLLSQQAVADHLDASPALRERLDLQKNQLLAMAEYQKMAGDIKVSPDEISQYFAAHQSDFASAQIRQFVVVKKQAGAPASEPGLSPADAHAKADAIRKALAAGTDVKKVAQDFAVPNTVLISPDPQTVQRGKMMAALDKAAFELKDGEVSDPVETPQALVFLQVVGHKQADQKSASTEIENAIKQQKLDAEMAEMKKSAGVWLDQDYFKGPAATSPAPASPSVPTGKH